MVDVVCGAMSDVNLGELLAARENLFNDEGQEANICRCYFYVHKIIRILCPERLCMGCSLIVLLANEFFI